MDPILAGLQAELDSEDDGWQVASYLAIVGCERITDSGRVEYASFCYMAPNQPGWVTKGLFFEADEQLREMVEED